MKWCTYSKNILENWSSTQPYV